MKIVHGFILLGIKRRRQFISLDIYRLTVTFWHAILVSKIILFLCIKIMFSIKRHDQNYIIHYVILTSIFLYFITFYLEIGRVEFDL